MSAPVLILRRAMFSRVSGNSQREDYNVFDGDRNVGRIYRMNAHDEIWFWGVSFDLTNRKSYGRANSLEEAKAAFRAEYEDDLGGRRMTIEQTARQDAIRGAIIGALAFLGVVLVLALVVFWF
jgi:hypothetical protein